MIRSILSSVSKTKRSPGSAEKQLVEGAANG